MQQLRIIFSTRFFKLWIDSDPQRKTHRSILSQNGIFPFSGFLLVGFRFLFAVIDTGNLFLPIGVSASDGGDDVDFLHLLSAPLMLLPCKAG